MTAAAQLIPCCANDGPHVCILIGVHGIHQDHEGHSWL